MHVRVISTEIPSKIENINNSIKRLHKLKIEMGMKSVERELTRRAKYVTGREEGKLKYPKYQKQTHWGGAPMLRHECKLDGDYIIRITYNILFNENMLYGGQWKSLKPTQSPQTLLKY